MNFSPQLQVKDWEAMELNALRSVADQALERVDPAESKEIDPRFKQLDCLWSNIAVGDLILVKAQQFFPADLVVLESSNCDGISYIQTSSLDGEKACKPIQSLKQWSQLAQRETSCCY